MMVQGAHPLIRLNSNHHIIVTKAIINHLIRDDRTPISTNHIMVPEIEAVIEKEAVKGIKVNILTAV